MTREPLDPRHPTRHTIWTPILDHIQDRVFGACSSRLNTRDLYIRNAIENADHKQKAPLVHQAVLQFRDMAMCAGNRPIMILCFGQFAFEFARRACDEPSSSSDLWGEWRVEELGREFQRRVACVSPERVTALPLLHAIVARRFDECHGKFVQEETGENYFEYVGRHLASALITHRSTTRLMPLFRSARLPA